MADSFDKDEQKSGVWNRFPATGQLMDGGKFVADKKVGEWRAFCSQGKPTKRRGIERVARASHIGVKDSMR